MNIILWVTTALLLVLSFIFNKQKTFKALKMAYKKLSKIFGAFGLVLIAYAFIVAFLTPDMIQKVISDNNKIFASSVALIIGSVSVMPGFAAFPLCAALLKQGVPYYALAAFSLALMNVGIATFPIEKKILGFKVTLARNIIAFAVCIITTIVFALFF